MMVVDAQKKSPSGSGRAFVYAKIGLLVFVLIVVSINHNSASVLLGFAFCFDFLDGHGLIHPIISSLPICFIGGLVATLDVGTFAIEQIDVGHGIIVLIPQLDGLGQHVNAFGHIG